jgi:uncharacterized protein YbjQ (UPF0145 family)
MISKKMFLAGLCALIVSGNVVAKKDSETSLALLIQEAADSFDRVTEIFESARSAYGHREKEYDNALHKAKKNALKKIKARLKEEFKAAKSLGESSYDQKRALYREFKEQVYRTWKATSQLPSA